MTPLQFQDLLDRYGDAVEAWPRVEREAATSLLAASPDARSRHARSRAFARLFDPGAVPPAPPADWIVARIVARPARRWRIVSPAPWMRLRRPQLIGLAACLLLGFAVGVTLPAQQRGLSPDLLGMVDGSSLESTVAEGANE